MQIMLQHLENFDVLSNKQICYVFVTCVQILFIPEVLNSKT